jgi:asparagine synthase (glutamine-hydrolysing)
MCGIAGIIKKSEDPTDYTQHLSVMLDSLHHRGPDDKAQIRQENAFLGHVRLSIIDPENAKQPMYSFDKKEIIVFNGEIYGYQELKQEHKDYPYITASDTELLLARFKVYGEQMTKELPGMFSFAIWSSNSLFAARDRFGEKPFFYAWGKNNTFIFASEIKAILASGLIKPTIDPGSIQHYLRHLHVAPSKTIYSNIYSLPPAHHLQLKDGKVNIERYWNFPKTHPIGLTEAKEEFSRLLRLSVEKQMVADVPVAAFLSGGLDSSTIVALASQIKPDIKTLSFGFDQENNELSYAKAVAQMYGTDHFELQEKKEDLSNLMIQMQSIYDEPFADSSNIATFLISKLAKEHSKVVLTGDGCDELMGGYDFWYRPALAFEKATLSKTSFRVWLKFLNSLSYRTGLFDNSKLEERICGINHTKQFDHLKDFFQFQRFYFTDDELNKLCRSELITTTENKPIHSLDDILRHDLSEYMPGDILVKTDRASMASGLELRAPFLDKDFAEFCISLPIDFKVTKRTEKYLLRETMSTNWPESVRKRKKQGFASDVNRWLSTPDVHQLKIDVLTKPENSIFEHLHYSEVQKYVSDNSIQTWILMNLSLWFNHIFNKNEV